MGPKPVMRPKQGQGARGVCDIESVANHSAGNHARAAHAERLDGAPHRERVHAATQGAAHRADDRRAPNRREAAAAGGQGDRRVWEGMGGCARSEAHEENASR